MNSLLERVESLPLWQRELLVKQLPPMSFAQQRLWFLDQLAPGDSTYNLRASLRVSGKLNTEALSRTVSEICRRHQILRTTFMSIDGRLVQVISAPQTFVIPIEDLSSLVQAEQETEAKRLVHEEGSKPFDLAHGPLLRVKLLRLSVEEHVVLFTMHHIVSDAWSMGLLIKEVATLYEAYSHSAESPLPELAIQYSDFAVWQREWLQGEELERQLSYWRKQLGGDLPVLELQPDRARPAVQTHRGNKVVFRLDAKISAGVNELSRREGATLFMTLLAAYQTLLHRYTGQNDIIVGSPVAGRNQPETEALIGFFINPLALRTDFSGEPTFVELLQRVKEVCLGAYAHQDVPFEKLVEELQPERDPSRSPVFQTMFVLQNAPRQQLRLTGLGLTHTGSENTTAKFDLMLTMVEKNGLTGVLEFNTDLFDERSIQRFGERFGELLRSIVAEPTGRVALLELETEVEREQKRTKLAERRTLDQVEGYELTVQQEQVWQRSGETWLWGALRVKGELEVERVQRVVQQIADREEVLRSEFMRLAGMDQPLQVLRGESAVVVEIEECEAAQSLEEWGRGGDWEEEQWAVKLWRVGGETVLAIRMSQLCSDRSTVRSVLEEVLAGYERELLGVEPSETQRVQYVDYGAWQKEVREEEGAEGRSYWEREQHSAERELRLGLERGASGGEWRRQRMTVASAVVEQLRRVAASEGVSEAAVLLSVWQLLLSLHTEAEAVEVESRVDGRGYEELQGALGRYDRWLPVRVRVRSESSWRELLRETGARLEEAEKWQEYFPAAGAGAGERIGFEYVSWTREWMGTELEAQWERLEERVGGQKLKLRGESEGSELWVELEYDAGVLSEAAAEWLSEQYVHLLNEVSRVPERLVSEAVLIGAREREQVLSGWNSLPVDSDEPRSVVQLFEAQVERTPTAVALINGAEQLSYEELNARANQLGHYLRAQGVGPDVLVGLCLERSAEMVVGLLGILKAGGAYLPLDPAYPRQRLEYMLADANVGLVLTQARLLDELRPVAPAVKWLALDHDWDTVAAASTENPPHETDAENLAYVIYTSGSTGRPKGVMITSGGLVNYLQYATATYPFTAGKGSPLHSTLSFDLTVTSLYAPLLVGGWTEVMSETRGPEEWWQERNGYGVVKLTPAHLRLLNGTAESATHLREWSSGLIVGGEALSWEQVRAWVAAGVRVFNEYGPTETVVGSCVYEAGTEERGANGSVPIGRPIRNTEMYVLDAWQQPVAVGMRGEIYIGGAGLARGYWQRAELTAERFVPHPYSAIGGERLYRTGDEGRFLEGGTIEYLGRADQQVKLRGYRVELSEIEAVLESHGGVRQAVVTVSEEQQLIGYVVGVEGTSWLGSEREAGVQLRAFLQERLPDYMVPQRWVVLDQMPLTANGKVDRRKLPEPSSRRALEWDEGEWTAVEEIVTGIWREVLKLEAIGRDENFFELGGHSLLATQVISRVREMFGVEVGLRRLFEEPTLRGFSRSIEASLRAGQGVVIPVLRRLEPEEREQSRGLLPLSFAQQRLWFLNQLSPESEFYNSFKAVRLRGELNVAALEQTLTEIVRRHEVLRTRFVNVSNEARQEVLAVQDVKLSITDFSSLDEPEAAIREAARVERREPFDLATGPMLRVKLLRLGDEEHVVLLTMHHIVSDAWSVGVLIREVATLYEAYSQGAAESPLPELPIQYADFAVWQRGWLQGEELERQLAYWRRQLGGEVPPLELPTDRERPAVPSYSGAQLNFRLSVEVSAGLKELSRREGVTLFMTLLAAFETLLHRHSGQQEIVVGTVLAGRTYRETESLIGFFLNTLALRTDLSGEPTFVELLQRVKEVCLGAYAHQDLPFEKLVEELQPERDLSRSPLFQVAFGLQNVPQAAARLGELGLQSVGVESESVRFDLTLWMTEGRESLGVAWTYRDELFSAERIEWLQGRFERLLEEIVAEPEWRLSQFAVESREEEAEREAREAERRAALEAGGVAELVAVDEVEGYELTAQQEQVWQRGGESWLWGAVRVAGELEVERVQRVVRELAATEEVLRSGFARLAGMEQPLQVLRGESALMVEVEEGEVVDDVEQWGRGGEWDEAGEQWSVKLWRVAGETVLAVRMRPLCGDRETVRSLIEEVLAGYERELSGVEQEEGQRRVQYADYGAWQKEVREEEGAEGKAYWEREQQRGSERELRLGLERGAVGGAWRQQRVTVASEVREQVKRAAAAEEVSEAAVMLSVWQMLLSRHTEAEVVMVESRVGGRGYEELQGAFGRYERWVPVQVRVRAEASWRELLRESAARLAEAEQWQEYFSGAAERIGFEYVTWARQWMGAELQARWERLEERVGGQKLKLRGENDASGLSIQLEYDAAVLSDAAAELLSEQYVQLLSEVSGAPAQVVSEAVLVSAREQAQVLGWNEPRINTDDTDQAGTGSEIERSVVQLFEARVEQRPEAIAIGCGATQLSFGELNRRANQLAHYLRAQGVGPEVVVGLCLERSVEMVVGLLGILKAGGAYLPLDPNYPRPRLEYLLGDAQVQLVLTQQRLLERLPVLGRAIALDQEWERIAAESTENPLPVNEAENLAYVIYTSGSTGQPKGVMISHGNLWQLLHGLKETVYAELGREPLHVGWNASLSFDASVKQWAQLLNGHAVYLLDEEERLEAGRVLEYVRRHEVQVLDTTPGQLRTWLEVGLREGAAGEQLAAVLVGGEAIDEQLWQELASLERPVFYNVYGPTECTVDATWSAVRGERAVLGQRLPHVSVYVLDEQLRLAPVGVRGELCIGGGGVGRGYWQRAELTAERYVPHPYSTVGGERLYRTGDEGRYLEDGTIEYLGRRDQQVKVRGYRIELGEIEAVLESHAAVRQAVVTVRDEQQLVAYLVARRGVQLHETSAGERSEGYEVSAGLRVAQQNKNETDYLYHEIFERRCYLQHGVSIERGDWVVDVGANIGLFSLQAAQLGAARVYAFEPLGPVCASLRQNARLGGGQIRVFEHGLSHEEQEAQFTYYPRYTMMSGQSEYADAAGEVEVIKRYLENEASGGSADAASLLKDADELLAGRFTGQVQQCRLRRLTDVLREEQVRRVDLLKIDVQRAEWDVLEGLAAEDWERIGQVVLEVHDWEGGRGRAAEIRELLQEKGYEVTVAQDELLVGTDRFNVYGVRRGYRENGNGNGHAPSLEEEDWTSGGEWEVSEVREHARERLPEYMVPQRWVVLEQMPLTAHGKVDRERLPAPASERAAEREAEGEWTPVEELVAGIWNEVLKQEVVGRGESFFELGGHSLLATQVISRVREVFGVEVGLRRLFEEPTLGGFSHSIEGELRAGAGVTVPKLQRLGATEREQWGGLLPLSFAQQRLWFLDQLERGNPFYNSLKAVRLKGELHVDALERTLSEIVRRHEVLRTRFVNVGGEPRQEVLEAAPLKLALTDFSSLSDTVRETAVREALATEKNEPFDLATGPMLRVKLLRLTDEEHAVLLTMHHIVSDGWSLGVLIKEVATLYEAYSREADSTLPDLPIQYADFAVWQRGWLQGEELERHLAYWRKQLGGTLPVLELPTDRERPATPSYNGAQLNFRLSPELSAALKELSRREGVTLFMTLLAAFQTLLHRHSGQKEILVGTAIANRNYRETEDLIGFFINQLVLRTDLTGEPTFVELLQRVKEVCLGAYAHQDLPFEKLVEELQPERHLSRAPIIQVHIGFQKAVRQTATIANTHFSPLGSEGTQARFDLTLWVTDLGQQLVLTWTFSTDLFNPETITNMHSSFETLLQDLLANPTKSIETLNMVSEKQAERETELFEESRERFRAVKPKAQTLQVKTASN